MVQFKIIKVTDFYDFWAIVWLEGSWSQDLSSVESDFHPRFLHSYFQLFLFFFLKQRFKYKKKKKEKGTEYNKNNLPQPDKKKYFLNKCHTWVRLF